MGPEVWQHLGSNSPVYLDGLASGYLGEEGEFKVSIPDALYKIVIKENESTGIPDVLSFIYPQVSAGYYTKHYDHSRYLTTVDEVELLTGLDFLTGLPDNVEQKVEKSLAKNIWPYDKKDIIRACKRS